MNTDIGILNDIINDKHVCGVPPHRDTSVTFEDVASQHDEVVDRPLKRRRVGVLRSRAAAVGRVVRVRHARLQRRRESVEVPTVRRCQVLLSSVNVMYLLQSAVYIFRYHTLNSKHIYKNPRPWKGYHPYARVEATLTPLCGVATPILMVPEASGGPGVYRSNPRPCALGFVSPGFESHAPPTCRA